MSNSVEQAKLFGAKVAALKAEIGKVVVGQEEVVEALLNAVFCHGHVLMVGVPGLAKTLLVKTLSQTMELSFNRIRLFMFVAMVGGGKLPYNLREVS